MKDVRSQVSKVSQHNENSSSARFFLSFGVSSPQYFRILNYENIGWLLPGLACRTATWLRLTKRKTRDAGLVFIAVLRAGEDSILTESVQVVWYFLSENLDNLFSSSRQTKIHDGKS